MKPSAVFFDLDGTLVDSRQDLARALNSSLEFYGAPALTVDVVTDLIGEGAFRLVEKALPAGFAYTVEQVLERFLKEYERNLVIDTVPYPGIPRVLEKLSADCPLAVVTNKREDLSEEVLEKLGLRRFMSLVVGPDTAGERKPSPAPLRYALDGLGIGEPARVLMVGDSSFDVIAGAAAGVGTVAVTWGYRPREELTGADYIIDRPDELLGLFGRSGG